MLKEAPAMVRLERPAGCSAGNLPARSPSPCCGKQGVSPRPANRPSGRAKRTRLQAGAPKCLPRRPPAQLLEQAHRSHCSGHLEAGGLPGPSCANFWMSAAEDLLDQTQGTGLLCVPTPHVQQAVAAFAVLRRHGPRPRHEAGSDPPSRRSHLAEAPRLPCWPRWQQGPSGAAAHDTNDSDRGRWLQDLGRRCRRVRNLLMGPAVLAAQGALEPNRRLPAGVRQSVLEPFKPRRRASPDAVVPNHGLRVNPAVLSSSR